MSSNKRKSTPSNDRSVKRTTGCFGLCCSRKKDTVVEYEKVPKARIPQEKFVPVDEQPMSQDACQWHSGICACDVQIEDPPIDSRQNKTSIRTNDPTTIKQMTFISPSEIDLIDTKQNRSSFGFDKKSFNDSSTDQQQSDLTLYKSKTSSCHTVEIEYNWSQTSHIHRANPSWQNIEPYNWEMEKLPNKPQHRSALQPNPEKHLSDSDSVELSFSVASVLPLNKRDTSSVASTDPAHIPSPNLRKESRPLDQDLSKRISTSDHFERVKEDKKQQPSIYVSNRPTENYEPSQISSKIDRIIDSSHSWRHWFDRLFQFLFVSSSSSANVQDTQTWSTVTLSRPNQPAQLQISTMEMNLTEQLYQRHSTLSANQLTTSASMKKTSDGHQQFSRKSVQSLSQVFEQFDTDRDQTLNLNELKYLMEKLGMPQTHVRLKDMIRQVDNDRDGKITFREFLEIFRQVISENEQTKKSKCSIVYDLYAMLFEIDVSKEGVRGAKDFFEAKITAMKESEEYYRMIREEQEQQRLLEEEKLRRKSIFETRRAQFQCTSS